jgi:hypothetical protein
MILNIYVDAFDLYYGCLMDTPYKWLNLRALCELSFPADTIQDIHYFTARIKPNAHDPDKHVRQEPFFRVQIRIAGSGHPDRIRQMVLPERRHPRPLSPDDGGEHHMTITTTVPVTISPEVRSFVGRMNQGEELEKIVDRARKIVPGLRSIEVLLDDATEAMPPGVVLWAHRDDVGPGNDPTHRQWIDWMAATFPPEVCQNFTLLSVYHDDER